MDKTRLGRYGRQICGRAWISRAALVVLLTWMSTAACVRLGPGIRGLVDLTTSGEDELRLTYLGTGGWIFQHGSDMVLAAPLFTNPSFLQTGLRPIRADTVEIDRHMAPYDVRGARAILSGHAHYDHLMDVPRVAAVHAPNARIVGSRTVANTLGSWSGVGGRVDVVDDSAGDQSSVGRWLTYGPGIRVMALRSHHAPHFDGYTLYQGSVDSPLASPPRYATEWLDGATFAFLIDFMDAVGEVAFRIYYQDAVVAPPLGFAPEVLIAQHPVDVAIFVPATFDQVDWHPEAFVQNLQPKRVLLGHWEDFFVPIDDPTRAIMLSDIGHFQDRLEHVFSGEWWRPEIGTEFRFSR
ncbi:MAG: hypothetical protein O2958_06365 [Gemmatimonadetes bacterium]|nr:hypothetical protein [Gemmatimonadota bacterium]MDA1103078.1 hypothetical protein [Gemmatimonadota bacterium]